MSNITSDIDAIISSLDPSGVMTFTALNERGRMIMSGIRKCMKSFEEREEYIRVDDNQDVMNVNVNRMDNSLFSEEYRSRQSSLFSALRETQDYFSHESDDGQLGFYGGFRHDLTFQFESM